MPVMKGIETVYSDTTIPSTMTNISNPNYGAPKGKSTSCFNIISNEFNFDIFRYCCII